MDILTLAGLVVAFGGIVGGMLIEGGHIGSLINGPAFLIVVCLLYTSTVRTAWR